ncbi:ribosome biogenesis GTPase Der [Candidatus Karelsulcia muelleri]
MNTRISIVGHPKVGKSTLFNYLVGSRQAITDYTHGTHGVTRDRIYGECKWKGNNFTLIDSGGYVFGNQDLEIKLREQFLLAIEESSSIIFLLDLLSGILPIDYQIGKILQRSNKTVVMAINKIDQDQYHLYERQAFLNLGFKSFVFISSWNGIGINELLDALLAQEHEPLSPNLPISTTLSILPRITIVGRKNVGKSSLINTLLNNKQRLVCDQPGTTRDGIEVVYNKFNVQCLLRDTAGLINKKRMDDDIDFYSFIRTTQWIDNSDLCLFMIDVQMGFNKQDLKVFNLIKTKRISIIILINKCDLIRESIIKEPKTLQQLKKNILKQIYPFTDVPIYLISNYTKQNIIKALKQGLHIIKKQQQPIMTSYFNKIMLPIIERNKVLNRTNFSIKYCVPILKKGINKFLFFSNKTNMIPISYKRFLEKQIRAHFDLVGIPITIQFKSK